MRYPRKIKKRMKAKGYYFANNKVYLLCKDVIGIHENTGYTITMEYYEPFDGKIKL